TAVSSWNLLDTAGFAPGEEANFKPNYAGSRVENITQAIAEKLGIPSTCRYHEVSSSSSNFAPEGKILLGGEVTTPTLLNPPLRSQRLMVRFQRRGIVSLVVFAAYNPFD